MGSKSKYPEDYLENDIYYRFCSGCMEFHSSEMFYVTKDNELMRICKEEQRNRNRINVQKHRNLETTQSEFTKKESERILINLGYETDNPDNPIHVQFEKKWGM